MATDHTTTKAKNTRPEVIIKVFPKNYVAQKEVKVLKELKKTNALILSLREHSAPYTCPYPFLYIRKISSTEKLPKNLKDDGDPLSDFFISLKTIRHSGSSSSGGGGNSGGSGRSKSGYAILAFKVTDDDRTHLTDPSWPEWSGASKLTMSLSKEYSIRKVACFKGCNVYPDVFKYVVMIEFVMDEEQSDLTAMDIMQKHRIDTMYGYSALYTDFHTNEIEQAIQEANIFEQ